MAISKIPSAGFQDNVKFRNIIINGSMDLAQRGTSANGLTNGSSGYHTVDRWRYSEGGTTTSEFTKSQSTDVPTGQGFATSLKMDCTTAQSSLNASNYIVIPQRVEGQNLQYLKKGTANAESVTMSFWVKSNKTGTYTIDLFDNDNTRQISKTYTINSASTWEKKTITFEGDTTGAFDNNNARSLDVNFWLCAGTDYTSGTLSTTWTASTNADRVSSSQVNLADSTSNEWYITGVQLEAGEVASDFEFLPFDVNFERCSRYYQLIASGTNKCIGDGGAYSNSNVWSFVHVKPFRTTPSIGIASGSNYYAFIGNGSSSNVSSVFVENNSTETNIRIANTSASVTQGRSYFLNTNNSSAFIGFDAEL